MTEWFNDSEHKMVSVRVELQIRKDSRAGENPQELAQLAAASLKAMPGVVAVEHAATVIRRR